TIASGSRYDGTSSTRSATRVCSAPESSGAAIATVSCPRRFAVRKTRTAISPRLATRSMAVELTSGRSSARRVTLRAVNDRDIRLRNLTYGLFVRLGRAPTAGEGAAELGRSRLEVLESWRRLHEAHALVLEQSGDSIRMANPFSAVP